MFFAKNRLDSLDAKLEQVFQNGSKTYFYSSFFFPREIRSKINILYAFVRIADDLVDRVPADKIGFWQFKNYYLQSTNSQNNKKSRPKFQNGSNSNSQILTNFLENSSLKNPNLSQDLEKLQAQNSQNLKTKNLKRESLEPENCQNSNQNITENSQFNSKNHLKNSLNSQVCTKLTKIETNLELANFGKLTKNLEINSPNPKNSQNSNLKNQNLSQNLEINLFHKQIIDAFVDLEAEYFEVSWTLAFLESMESDLEPPIYETLEQTQKYIYGSANVIGLFMARILELPAESYYFAEHLGMSFQYINFIRDIAEDLDLGRSYFPTDLLVSCNLQSLKLAETCQKPENFRNFTQQVLQQYQKWQQIGEEGFSFFPKKYRTAIKTASDMYKWTSLQIAKDPFIVYQKKIKPQKRRVLLTGVSNWLLN